MEGRLVKKTLLTVVAAMLVLGTPVKSAYAVEGENWVSEESGHSQPVNQETTEQNESTSSTENTVDVQNEPIQSQNDEQTQPEAQQAIGHTGEAQPAQGTTNNSSESATTESSENEEQSISNEQSSEESVSDESNQEEKEEKKEDKKEEQPGIFGEYGVAIDAKTGTIIYDKNAKDAAYPASMTKVLTALIIAEKMGDDEKIKVTPDAIGTECSCYGVEKGEELSKEDAIHALMIKSANDVAVAAAEHISGSVEKFAKVMNKRAKEIGVSEDTNFVTPNGLTDEKHHVTAYDMALIVREAIKNPEVLDAMKAKDYKVKSNKKDVELTRHDNIFKLPHAIGGKTGYTSAAGNTLAVYYKKGDKEVITVVMKSDAANHYSDSEIMSEYAFKHMKSKVLYKKNEKIDEVKIGSQKVNLLAKNDFYVSYNKGHEKDVVKNKFKVKTKVTINDDVIKKGEVIAKAEVYKSEEVIGELSLVSSKDLTVYKDKQDNSKNQAKGQISIWWALVIPWLIYGISLIMYNLHKRKERRKIKRQSAGK
ncbi:hypothetical protein CN918_27930 [Priestia megaterium]|nr:hypothetical protein CN918_27930 [Priestia megaterium]